MEDAGVGVTGSPSPLGGASSGNAPPSGDGEPGGFGFRFTLAELSGGLGDLGTFLPIAVGLCVACDLGLPAVLVWAGVLNAATGGLFRQPIPVQPMKAVAAVAIGDRLSAGDVRAAGLLTGAVVLLVGVTGAADRLGRAVPAAVVRGLQLAVGVKLAARGADLALGDWNPRTWEPADGWATAAGLCATAAVLLAPRARRVPALVLLVLAGLTAGAVGWWPGGSGIEASRTLGGSGTLPDGFLPPLPGSDEWRTAAVTLLPAQLPLTLLNSVVAVCLLSSDYFPGRGVRPGRMAASVGLMNLATVPLGGMPVCHGAGGLAAQHHFGARTGGAVVMLGGLKVAGGLALLALPAAAVTGFPPPLLGALLVAAGWRLAAAARKATGAANVTVAVGTGAAVVALGTLWGVAAGVLIRAAVRWGLPAGGGRGDSGAGVAARR